MLFRSDFRGDYLLRKVAIGLILRFSDTCTKTQPRQSVYFRVDLGLSLPRPALYAVRWLLPTLHSPRHHNLPDGLRLGT